MLAPGFMNSVYGAVETQSTLRLCCLSQPTFDISFVQWPPSTITQFALLMTVNRNAVGQSTVTHCFIRFDNDITAGHLAHRAGRSFDVWFVMTQRVIWLTDHRVR